jgi:hypothetical protein
VLLHDDNGCVIQVLDIVLPALRSSAKDRLWRSSFIRFSDRRRQKAKRAVVVISARLAPRGANEPAGLPTSWRMPQH